MWRKLKDSTCFPRDEDFVKSARANFPYNMLDIDAAGGGTSGRINKRITAYLRQSGYYLVKRVPTGEQPSSARHEDLEIIVNTWIHRTAFGGYESAGHVTVPAAQEHQPSL